MQTQAADLEIRYDVKARVYPFDALDLESHETILARCLSDTGERLAGAVLCVGYLGDQNAAQTDFREARRILDTNFTGCVSALNVISNHFEKQGSGFICALSSVAGDRGRQSNYFYGAAKAALSAYLQGLGPPWQGTGAARATISMAPPKQLCPPTFKASATGSIGQASEWSR